MVRCLVKVFTQNTHPCTFPKLSESICSDSVTTGWCVKKREHQLLMHSVCQPPPTYFLLSTSQPGLWEQNRQDKMWKPHICTWFKEWVGKRWRQSQRKKIPESHKNTSVSCGPSKTRAFCCYLSSSCVGLSLLHGSSSSLQSLLTHQAVSQKEKKKSHECKQRGHSSQKPKVALLYLCMHS